MHDRRGDAQFILGKKLDERGGRIGDRNAARAGSAHRHWHMLAERPELFERAGARRNPAAANQDQLDTQFYNGIPTVQAKTALAMTSGGGIMAWDLSQDTHDAQLSLLSAIYNKSHAQ